jgi:hypothetical protein
MLDPQEPMGAGSNAAQTKFSPMEHHPVFLIANIDKQKN